MRRASDQHNESLDLLLDTITNTFGGVLFIAILVTVLLQFTGRAHEEKHSTSDIETNPLELESELRQTLAERDSLQRALAEQEAMSELFDKPHLRQQFREVSALRRKRDALDRDRLEAIQQITQKQSDVDKTRQELEELEDTLAEAEKEAVRAEQSLRSEVTNRTQTARLPKTKSSSKLSVALVMRYDRLYFKHKPGGTILSRELNLDDFVIIDEDDETVTITPRPDRGISVDGSDASNNVIARRLSNLDPTIVRLDIAVWEDSFDMFVHTKNIMIERGFDYRLVPIGEGGSVIETDVPNPLAQ